MTHKKRYFFVSTIISIVFIFYFFLFIRMEIKENFHRIEQEVRDREWTYIVGKITQLRIHAKDRASALAKSIKKELFDTYDGDISSMRRDIFSIEKRHSRASEVFEKMLISSFFLLEKSDSDDPFVISDIGVISDFSFDCSQDSRMRTFEQEVALHWNKPLAKRAIREILSYGDTISKPIFWQFTQQENLDFLVKSHNLDEVEVLYKKHGVDFLRSLEFLEFACLDDKVDIFGTAYSSGRPSKRLIVVQGFNATKQIFFAGDGLKAIGDFRETFKKVAIAEKNIVFLSDILLSLILFILVILYLTGALAISESEKNGRN